MRIVGLDIGGANIKASDDCGRAISRPFAIWRDRDRLSSELASVFEYFPIVDQVAVTMTAELADCFSTKAEGIRFILAAVEECTATAIRSRVGPENVPNVLVWSVEGHFVSPRDARDSARTVASANWHALATWCGKFAPTGASLLIDIGTTTTDVIPLIDGCPAPAGFTDVSRLQSGELSYSGAWRTPLCAVAHSVPFRDGYCSIAAEVFATMLDVNLLLGHIAEDDQNCDTANGKPATRSAAHDRIARMLCCDRDEVSLDEAVHIARFLSDVQRQRLAGSLERVCHRLARDCGSVILSGSGTFLARQLVDENRRTTNCEIILLADRLSREISDAACAYAVAQLALQPN